MKRVLAVILTVIMLATTAVGMASCSGSDEGKTIKAYYVSSLYDFDPSLACLDDDAMDIFNLVYEPLFILNEDGELEDGLAEDYEINEEENSMTITLAETYWSGGDCAPVTSEDVLFAWQRILDPNTENQAAALLYEVKNAVNIKRGTDEDGNPVTISDIGVELNSDREFTIYFENENVDYEAFMRNLTSVALTPLRESVVSQRDEYWSKRKATVETNGPFTFGYIDYDAGMFTITRNKNYRRNPEKNTSIKKFVTPYAIETQWYDTVDDSYEGIYLSSLQLGTLSADSYTYYANQMKAWLDKTLEKFEQETVFYVGELSLEAREEYKNSELLTLSDAMSTYSYVMNCAKFPASVRVALSSVIDREELIREVTVFGKAADGFISGGLFDGSDGDNDFRENGGSIIKTTVDEATVNKAVNALYAAAANGTFDFNKTYYISCKSAEEDLAVAAYIAKRWESVFGISVEIKPLSWSEGAADEGGDEPVKYKIDDLRKAYISGNFDIIAVDYQMLAVDPFVALAGFSSTYNGFGADFSISNKNENNKFDTNQVSNGSIKKHPSGYSSNSYDALIEGAYQTKDMDARAKILHQAEALLMRDMPVIPLYYNQNFYLKSDKLSKIEVGYNGFAICTKAKLTADVEETEEDK